jgi:hypothetical protein
VYVKPGHAPQNPARTPPEERGKRLATLPRGRGDEELRVNLDEYNGHPYIALRVWKQNGAGDWWPIAGKGLSIKTKELLDVAEALQQAAEMVGQGVRQ